MGKVAIITGISGQDGSYLAELLLKKKYKVYGILNPQKKKNLKNLKEIKKKLFFRNIDLNNYKKIKDLIRKIKPSEFYHLAAQSFINYKFEDEFFKLNPNINGTHYILSAIKQFSPKTKFYFAGSSEMFGKVKETPQTETTPFYPRSVYGISKEKDVKEDNVAVIFELTLKDLTADGKISVQDFLDRADLLSSLGYTVMVSNYLKHYKMVEYLAPISRGNLIGVILGVYNLNTIFDERYYENLSGGLLEAFGRGFGPNMKLYVYPALNVEDGEIYDLDNIEIADNLKGLLHYMRENDKMKPILEFNPKLLHIMSDDVLSKIRAGASSWEDDVPQSVAKAIKAFELFGYHKKEVKV